MATKLDRFPKKYFNAEMLKASGPRELEIEQERLQPVTDQNTGETTEKSVLSFVGIDIKLVLNVTNWESVEYITGSSNSDDWPGCKIELYVEKTRMGAKQVDGVRIRAPSSGRSAFAGKVASPPALSASANKQSALAGATSPSSSSPPADELDDGIPF
jgi:hypothetical protein